MGEMREMGEMTKMREIREMTKMREIREMRKYFLLNLPHLPLNSAVSQEFKKYQVQLIPVRC